MPKPQKPKTNTASIYSLFRPYIWSILILLTLTIAGNGLNLVIPQLISHAIDSYSAGAFVFSTTIIIFSVVTVSIFVLLYLQSIVQVYLSERVAKNLRTQLIDKISHQDYDSIQKI